MSGIIKDSDLFDFDGYSSKLKALESTTADVAQSLVTWFNRVKSSEEGATQQLKELYSSIATLSSSNTSQAFAQFNTLNREIDRTAQQLDAARQSQKSLSDAQKLNGQVVDDLTKKLADLYQRFQSLDPAQKDYAKQQRAVLNEVRTVSRAIDAQSKSLKAVKSSADAAEGSYKHLQKQTTDLRNQLKSLNDAFDANSGAINKNNRVAVDLLAQIQKNDRALKNMSASMGQHQLEVGNYQKALQGLAGELTGITSVAGGLMLAFQAGKAGLEVMVEMERWNAGLQAASRDSADFSRSQQFLISLSDKLGQSYGVLADSYKLIKDATKDTNLEGRETEHIFSAVATAGAKLKLSNETVTGTLLALIQMISKGHIQAEELRGQLGERLPSAIRLMSEALGVSETKLNKMMEQGQLIAKEVMPQFATALDKAYGLKQGEKIEGLTANINRLKNEVALLLDEFNKEGRVTNFFGKITGGIAGVLRDIRNTVKDGAWVEFFTYLMPGMNGWELSEGRRKGRQILSDERSKFGSMGEGDRYLYLQKLQQEEEEARKKGDKKTADGIADFRRKLRGDAIKMEAAEIQEDRRKAAIAEKDAIEKNETDIARFQKQSVKKRMAELIALEKQVKADPNDAVAATKLDLYKRLDDEQKVKDQEVKDRLKAERGQTESEANRRLNEALSKAKAVTDDQLAKLNDNRQDGLVSEQKFIEERLKITLDGLNKRQVILEKAGKKETDDYLTIQAEKKKADTQYTRSQLNLDLANSKLATSNAVSNLDVQHNDGTLSDLQYVEDRHKVLKDGFERDKAILKEANQENSELFRQTHQNELEEQADYLARRLSAEKKAWKDSLELTKESLKSIDENAANQYETSLSKIHRRYNGQREDVDSAVSMGRITPKEANQRMASIDANELKDELDSYKKFVAESKILTNELINDRIEKLRDWAAYSGATEKEVEAVNKQIAALEKLRRESDADDEKKTQTAIANNSIEQSDRERQHKKRNAEEEKREREALIDLVTRPVQGAFQLDGLKTFATASLTIYDKIQNHKKHLDDLEKMSDKERKAAKLRDLKDIAEATLAIGGAVVDTMFSFESQKTANEISQLDIRKQHELELVGNNEDAKAAIEKKYDSERKRLQHEQDVQARNRAVFQLAIQTAVASIEALPNLFLSLFIAGLGAAAIAATLAQPLPAYKIGKRPGDSYEGLALAGEAGAELLVDREGASRLLNRPTLINTKKGDTIYTAHETAGILRDIEKRQKLVNPLDEINLNSRSVERLQQGRFNEQAAVYQVAMSANPALTEAALERAFGRALDARPSHETHIDRDGFKELMKSTNGRVEYRERRYRLG